MINMNNKTVYLSGGITGVDGYRDAFANAEDVARSAGARVILNPATLPHGWDWEHYMAACLGLVRVADMVVMLPGWQRSTGARMERGLAMTLALPCFELAEVGNG